MVEIFREHKITIQDFLRMQKADFGNLGISDEGDQEKLLEGILEIHKEPWKESSLIPPPAFLPLPPAEGEKPMSSYYPQPHHVLAAQRRPPEFDCLSLGGMLSNVESQLIHMESGLISAERLIRAYEPAEREKYGYTTGNIDELVSAAERISVESKRLESRALFMKDALKKADSECKKSKMLKYSILGGA